MGILGKIRAFIATLAEDEPENSERSIGMSQIGEQVMGQLEALAAQTQSWAQVHDLYTDAGGAMSVVFSMNGHVYQAGVTMSGGTAILGGIVEVEQQFAPVRSISIIRQADGTARWLAVAAAAVLNRVGEIDSRALFDSFIANTEAHGYPELRFFHDARLVLGKADWTARDGNLYLASGTLAEGDLPAAFIDACEQGRGVWGCSIGFMPTEPPRTVEIARGLGVPVYAAGVNTEISVLPESAAASWFTTIGLEVKRDMDEAKRTALITILGDEEKARTFLAGLEATNRSIEEQGLITRQEPEAPASPAPVVEERHATTEVEKDAKAKAETEAQHRKELAAEVLAAANVGALEERLAKMEKQLAELVGGQAAEKAERSEAGKRLAAMEETVTRWKMERDADMPPQRTLSATYRPRDVHAKDAAGPLNLGSAADATLAQLKTK